MLANKINNRSFFVSMTLVYIIGLVIRIMYVILIPQDLTFDEPYYDHIAHQISEGGKFTFAFSAWFTSIPNQPTSVQEPVFPFFQALMEKIFGEYHHVGSRTVLAFFGAFIPVAIGILGIQIFNYKTGVLAAYVLAIYPPLVFFGRYLMTEILYIFFLVGAVFHIMSPLYSGKLHRVLAGALFGLACLTRGALLGFAPLLLLSTWLTNSTKNRRVIMCCVAAGIILVIAPWSIRNFYVHKAIVPITTKGGWNLYFYNYPVQNYDFNGRWDLVEVPDLSHMTEVERDKEYTKRAINFIVQNPVLIISFGLYKFVDFWNPILEGKGSWLNLINVASYGVFALLALITSVRYALMRKWQPVILFWFIVAFYNAQAMLFTGGGKARLPIEPLLVLLGCNTLLLIGQWLFSKFHLLKSGPTMVSQIF